MTIPQNTVQQQGQGAASADYLNSKISLSPNVANLRTYTALNDMTVLLLGTATEGDGGQGAFYFSANSTATDDNGVTTVTPNGNPPTGRWLRLPFTGVSPPPPPPPPPSAFVPYAAQMTLSTDMAWSGQQEPTTFWVPWDSLVTSAAPTPAYNPDNMASLTTIFPPGSPMHGAFPTGGPGFTIPVAGVYKAYAYINLNYAEVPGPGPLDDSFEVFIECGTTPWPTDGQVLNSDVRPGILTNGPKGFVNINVEGGLTCNAGDVLAMGVVDNGTNNGANLTVTGLSYFGIYRVR